MNHRTMLARTVLAASAVILGGALLVGCSSEGNDRWVTTENTNVKIDWDKINEAYKNAEGPADFETKVNEIYEGDEIISVAVKDGDDKSQVVTGFFDKNNSGTVEEAEKIFTINRKVTGEKGEYQINGHGPHYGYYHSPMHGILTGMLVGSMISSWSRPGYAASNYTTSNTRTSQLRSQRSAYRAKNPSRFSRSTSGRSGRSYGSGSSRSSSRRSGGGGFGIARARKRKRKPVRLTA